uniref:Transmembrane protein 53 n=1 Tax=Cyclophora tenuis TaxID=216820 RepID=A0A7S1CZI7_CYCTE|mmetsp:Transcript_14006/g.23762  ORF Transcript_14006/g.23762 Transcript_14006/m.23762 type:complete len:275 (+) Transcript_14006:27-851(+)
MNQKTELRVNVPQQQDASIRAVVVVLGWFGSKLRHVQKYSELYEARQCATITGHLDELTVLLTDSVKIEAFVQDVVHEAAKLLRMDKDTPLVLHAFSNGGALVIKAIEQHIDRMNSLSDSYGPDWQIVRERLACGAEFFDSSPVYIHPHAIQNSVKAGISSTILQFFASMLMWFLLHLSNFLSYAHGIPTFRESYWNHWTSSPRNVCPTQAYVYSTADDITDPAKVLELTKIRAQKGVNVLTKCFDDTGHVQHLLKRKPEYCVMINTVLSAIEK